MRRNARFDDEFDVGQRPRDYENPTSAGMIGFILAMASLGLVVVVAILWYAMNVEDEVVQNNDRRRMMLYWFLILDVVSFLIALTSTIFAGRGLSPTNPLYRGWALMGLILSIGEMIFTAIAFFILTCFALVAEINRAGG